MDNWLKQACTGISGTRIVITKTLYVNNALIGRGAVCKCAGNWVQEHDYSITKDYSPGKVQLRFDGTGGAAC
jgi:hypothetical protein